MAAMQSARSFRGVCIPTGSCWKPTDIVLNMETRIQCRLASGHTSQFILSGSRKLSFDEHVQQVQHALARSMSNLHPQLNVPMRISWTAKALEHAGLIEVQLLGAYLCHNDNGFNGGGGSGGGAGSGGGGVLVVVVVVAA